MHGCSKLLSLVALLLGISQISFAQGLSISGGISSGYLWASNAGEEAPGGKFLISNLLLNLSAEPKGLPISFEGAIGGTVTPSLFDAPGDAVPGLNIQYAGITVSPGENLNLEMGLLQPNAGYEDTYTYNNESITVGVLASQQPFNAFGVRATYTVAGLETYVGFYKDRLDEEEYCASLDGGLRRPSSSWEIGIGCSLSGIDFTLYHYGLRELRYLTGMVAEHEIGGLHLALDLDYWRWDDSMSGYRRDSSSMGGAFYASYGIGKASMALRLEYIRQGGSMIYTEGEEAGDIYAATFTPTYNFDGKAYVRLESSYVKARGCFEDNEGDPRDDRIYIALESGLRF